MKHVLMAISVFAGVASAQHADFGYVGEHGPAHWGGTCEIGVKQSPIDIKAPFAESKQALKPLYKEGGLTLENNGHTLEVWVDDGSALEIDKERYKLIRFHFHRPSEETISGKPAAMTAHFVHLGEVSKKIVVLGVLLKEGKENATIQSIWAAQPEDKLKFSTFKVGWRDKKINPAALLPANLSYYMYEGSLTTPPCTEGVTFYILKEQVDISKGQVEAFPFKLNARPVQKLGDRKVYSSK